MKARIVVNHDGTTCDVTIPGEFAILFTTPSIVEAIEFCDEHGYEYDIHYAEFNMLQTKKRNILL